MYTELHLHDYYSTLDGLNSPTEYMARAKELGMTHLAQTNHGSLVGHRDFQRSAKEAGITPILGVEAYISATDRFDRRSTAKREDGTSAYNHIILLAQNETGIKTLYKLNEIAWSEGFYNKPRIDLDALEESNDGLIVLSGCLNSLLCKAIENGDMDRAIRAASRLKSILGDRFYIEVQTHNGAGMNEALLNIADKMSIKPVITSDCHYARQEDLWIEEAMLILSTNPKPNFAADYTKSQKMDLLERFNYLYPDRRMTFEKLQLFLNDRDSHLAHIADGDPLHGREDIFSNTMEIANSIGDYPYHEGLDLLPKPKNANPDDLLEKKAWAGFKKRGFKLTDQEYVDRLNEELTIIKDKNFSTYFLIIVNMITWARGQGILVGPGRGSGAGSLLNYCLEITQADPIKEGLLFFRFIDPSRNDFPDIDVDFEDKRRWEVKQYLQRQFKHVASIATVNKFQGKSAVRAAARVFRTPLVDVNKALKAVDAPTDKPELFFKLFKESDAGKEFNRKHPEVMKLTQELTGRISNIGMHASGIVTAKEPIANFAPIESAVDKQDKTGGRIPLVPLDMNEAADLGLIKLDALGLSTLTVISEALKAIKERHGKDIDLLELPLDDRKVYQMLSEGYTKGVFQAEGPAYTKWILSSGGVQNFNDLVVGTSVARPGPMNTVGVTFRNRKAGKEPVKYDHPVMEKHLSETLGCIIYQEQVMMALVDLGGMTMVEANKVRKVIGKKLDKEEMAPYKEAFVAGAKERISEKLAEKLWHDFEEHTGYSFNKSHAYVYSMITYWTAWLKAHYPTEFMFSVLLNEADKESITDYLIEAKRLGIKILLPHVERSGVGFQMEGNALRFGLANVKYLSEKTAPRLIEQRPFGSYKVLEEKVMEKGNGLNSRALSALNAVGAAAYADNPVKGTERENFYEYLNIPAFETPQVPPKVKAAFRTLDEYTEMESFPIMAMVKKVVRKNGWARAEIVDETGTAGIFFDETMPIEPGQMYAMLVGNNSIMRFAPVDELKPDSKNSFVKHLFSDEYPDLTDNFYKVVAFNTRRTKRGDRMANMVISDGNKEMACVLVFPQVWKKAYGKCKEGATVGLELGSTDDGALVLKEIY
jgi:DNA polymerase-3 subunit alpha